MWITFKLSEHHRQSYRNIEDSQKRNIADELSEHRRRLDTEYRRQTIGTSKTVYRNIADKKHQFAVISQMVNKPLT
ncbi:MAG: hypothetical protein AAFQ80_17635 [Cyanobacteria bacterium J06621_8]